MKTENCFVGPFRLPGLKLNVVNIPEELTEEMQEWAKFNKCGTMSRPDLWSFRSEAKREWFVLRWVEELNKLTSEDDE